MTGGQLVKEKAEGTYLLRHTQKATSQLDIWRTTHGRRSLTHR